MKRHSLWDYLAWLILILIALWIILKVSGMINTPIWVQYSPLFGAIYLAGWAMSKLDRATKNISDMKHDVKNITTDVNQMETDINILRRNCQHLKKQE